MADRFERHKQPWTPDELSKLRILATKGKEIGRASCRERV